ncbi:MAG: N-acetylmuramoyl-L-alanine amidase [Pseudorhodobacter sp.]|nr:N-acetylmuramoyl-L-alanine amidase [Frankiaceae bacterium]
MTTRSPAPVLPPLTGRTVVLDPGHNGLTYRYRAQANALVPAGGFRKACQTTGTSTDAGYSEHAFNWVLANRTAALLRAHGARVVLSRPDDVGVGPCVNQRAALANAAHALLVISLHADGGPSSGYGFHVIEAGLAPDGGNRAFLAASHRLALDIRRGYQAATGESFSTYLGQQGLDRRSDLAGLNLTRLPAVFIECGNMRNSSDAAKLGSAAFQQRAAQGLLAAVEAFAAGR